MLVQVMKPNFALKNSHAMVRIMNGSTEVWKAPKYLPGTNTLELFVSMPEEHVSVHDGNFPRK